MLHLIHLLHLIHVRMRLVTVVHGMRRVSWRQWRSSIDYLWVTIAWLDIILALDLVMLLILNESTSMLCVVFNHLASF
jgi:hypothetical protein